MTIEKGHVYFVTHRPSISIRVIDVVTDEPTGNVFVVFLYELTPNDAISYPYDKFVEMITLGLLMKRPDYKYSVGQAFYGVEGNLYIIQHLSNINHKDGTPRYFMTAVTTMTEEMCEPDTWGKLQGNIYKLQEAIMDETTLDALEPYDTFTIIDELSFDNLLLEFEALKEAPVVDTTDPGAGTKLGGYVI